MSAGIGSLLPLKSRSINEAVSEPETQTNFNLGELAPDKSVAAPRGKAPLPRPPGNLPPTERDGEQRFPRMSVQVKDSPLPGLVTVEDSGTLEEVRVDAELPVKPLGGKLEATAAVRTSPQTGVTNVDTGARFTMPRAGDEKLNLNARVSLFDTTNMTTNKTTQNLLVELRANAGDVFVGADIRRRNDPNAPFDIDKYAGVKLGGDTILSVRSRSVGDRPVQDSLRIEHADARLEIGKDRGEDWFLRGTARWDF